MTKHLIVDGQLFQTPAWDRGMGKYSLELLAALVENNKKIKRWSTIELLFSNKLKQDKSVFDKIKKELKGIELTSLSLKPSELDNLPVAAENRKKVDEHISKRGLDDQDADVDYLILSLLQSEVAPVLPSLPNIHKAILFYDIIPLMFHQTYLTHSANRQEYTTKLAELFRADTYLAISKTVANDLAIHTGIDPQRIVNIDGGPIAHSDTVEYMDIAEPFILMPTGNDLRKNNRRAIEAFGRFQKKHSEYSLVITSGFKDVEIEQLSKLAEKVIFTGNVTGSQLNGLYDKAEALFFPTEYEGLGLPILEAMENKKPILCSDISVFREITTESLAVFDPFSIDSMVLTLERLAEGRVKVDGAVYDKVLGQYTWPNTAEKTINAFNRLRQPVKQLDKKTVIFGPSPSTSITGKHILRAHAELSLKLNATYILQESSESNREMRVNYLPFICTGSVSTPLSTKVNFSSYDEIVYHIDNTRMSTRAFFTALANPGVVVLHSTNFEGLWAFLLEDGFIDTDRYKAEKGLNDAYDKNGEHWLVSLLAHQKHAVVFTKGALNEVNALLKRMKISLEVHHVDMPTGTLVYPEVMPEGRSEHSFIQDEVLRGGELIPHTEKTWKIYFGITNDLEKALADTLINPTDAQYVDCISRSKNTYISSDNSLQFALDAVAVGARPYILEMNNGSYKFREYLESSDMKDSLMNHIKKQHTFSTYAERLVEIIANIVPKRDDRS